eukprot:1157934-Pelagomonas_calceolata.AAC.5
MCKCAYCTRPNILKGITLTQGRQTPLLIASECGHKDIAALLLDAGADVDKPINVRDKKEKKTQGN